MAKKRNRLMAPTKSKLMKRIVKGIEKTVPPASMEQYLTVVMVAKRILFDASTTDDALSPLKNEVAMEDIPDAVTQVVVDVLDQVNGQSGGKIVHSVLVSAAVPVAVSVLNYIEIRSGQKVTKNTIQQTVKSVVINMMHSVGVNGETVDRLMTGNYSMKPQSSAEPAEGERIIEQQEAGAPVAPIPLMAAGGQV